MWLIILAIFIPGCLWNADLLVKRNSAKTLLCVLGLMFLCVICAFVGGGNAELLK